MPAGNTLFRLKRRKKHPIIFLKKHRFIKRILKRILALKREKRLKLKYPKRAKFFKSFKYYKKRQKPRKPEKRTKRIKYTKLPLFLNLKKKYKTRKKKALKLKRKDAIRKLLYLTDKIPPELLPKKKRLGKKKYRFKSPIKQKKLEKLKQREKDTNVIITLIKKIRVNIAKSVKEIKNAAKTPNKLNSSMIQPKKPKHLIKTLNLRVDLEKIKKVNPSVNVTS